MWMSGAGQVLPRPMTTKTEIPASACLSAFERAARSTSSSRRFVLRIAGQTTLLNIAGQAAEDAVLPALEHLCVQPSGTPGPELFVWDQKEASVPFPAPDLETGDQFRNGCIETHADSGAVLGYREEPGTAFRLEKSRGWFAFFDAETIPWYERAAPLRDILNAILIRDGSHIAHSAAVATEDGAALLIGEGGAGKSSTALECLRAGMDYLGDDWCAVQPGAEPTVHSLFNSAKLRPDCVEHFNEFQPRIHNRDRLEDEKATVYLHRWRPERMRLSAPVRCILLPRVVNRPETTVEPATPRDCRDALLPVTLRSTPGCGASSIPLLVRIAHCAPVFRLNLGTERQRIPGVVEEAIYNS